MMIAQLKHTDLKLSSSISLPIDAATQTFAFIGRKGSGKTYGAGKLVELLIGVGVQVAILDTVGNWYGLRLAADGRGPGLDIPIIGGLRGDIPLEPTAGALIADVLVESGRSMILDASQFSKADRQRFAAALGERLWRRKKAEKQPAPVHLVLEESQLIVPERVTADTAKTVGVYEEIIRLGRNYGIGATMISQRPQSVNKEVLNQTECLMVFQTNGAHERKALKDWIVYQGMDTGILERLPALQPGECFVWSPQWLQVLRQIRIAEKTTYDSTATPRASDTRAPARDFAAIDLADLQQKMKETIDRAKAEDPRELRKKIQALEAELAAARKETPAPARIEVPIVSAEAVKALELFQKRLRDYVSWQEISIEELDHEFIRSLETCRRIHAGRPAPLGIRAPASPAQVDKPPIKKSVGGATGSMQASGGLRRMMIALADRRQGLNTRQLGVRAGLSSKSGTFTAYLSRARAQGWIEGTRDRLVITAKGLEDLGSWEPLPTGSALLQYWLSELGGSGAARMLNALADSFPHSMSKQDLAAAANLTGNSGTFTAYLSRLRSLELIEGRGEFLRMSDELTD